MGSDDGRPGDETGNGPGDETGNEPGGGTAAAGTHRPGASTPARSPAVIRAELAEAERYLTDAPPHHGAGSRHTLHLRIAALQRELAAAGG